MNDTHIGLFFASSVVLCVTPAAAAEMVSVGASKDNTIASNVVDNNNGASDSLFSGGTSFNGLRRALLAFDLSGVPSGSVVTSVSLSLTQTKGLVENGPQEFSLHKLTSDWGEGDSAGGGNGAPASPGASTWNENFFGSSSWLTAGGDFLGAASAAQTFSTDSVVVNSTPGLVADVQGWVDNGSSFGWALLGNEATTNTAWRFASREASSGGPMLTVTYTPIPEPVALFLAIVVGYAQGCRRG